MYVLTKDPGVRSNLIISNTDTHKSVNLGPITTTMMEILKEYDIMDLTIDDKSSLKYGMNISTTHTEAVRKLQTCALNRYSGIKIKTDTSTSATTSTTESTTAITPKQIVNAIDVFMQYCEE